MSSDLRAYRVQSEIVDAAVGFSSMAFVTLMPGCIMSEVRYRFGQTGFILGVTLNSSSGATPFYPISSMTLGIHLPSSAIGGLPVRIPGPAPFYLGALGTSGVGFEVTRYFSAGT